MDRADHVMRENVVITKNYDASVQRFREQLGSQRCPGKGVRQRRKDWEQYNPQRKQQ